MCYPAPLFTFMSVELESLNVYILMCQSEGATKITSVAYNDLDYNETTLLFERAGLKPGLAGGYRRNLKI